MDREATEKGRELTLDEMKNMRKGNLMPILARDKGEYFELNGEIRKRRNLVPVYTDDYVGHKAYERTLSFILVTAFYRVFQDLELIIDHSISRGLYCWIKGRKLQESELKALEEEMRRIVREDYAITKECVLMEDALKMFLAAGDMDKYLLLKNAGFDEIKMYRLLDQ